MSTYSYHAIDASGLESRGRLEVSDQAEALRRIKEMGLFPTKVYAQAPANARAPAGRTKPRGAPPALRLTLPGFGKVKPARLAVFTRQLATLVEAGMPLLRGLRVLQEQEEHPGLRRVIGEIASDIENGCSLAEALAGYPRLFNRLYVNMVKAGEMGGALEVTLRRLAEFLEKARKLRGKVQAALFYPCAVLLVATAILGVLMAYVVPKFQLVFDGLMNGRPLPAFTRLVFQLSSLVQHQIPLLLGLGVAVVVIFALALRSSWGRWSYDRLKLVVPVLGPLFRKTAISRFTRTLGTLVSNGVPILQALTIVKETAGNVAVGGLIANVHDHVKQGDPMAPTLKASRLFPAMVAGMVDVGEQTGALPDMLLKIADNYDDEVDNATNALTSLLEPILIIFLAVIVGSIVIAMFLPLIGIVNIGFDGNGQQSPES
jgi:type IV pilus assembly protein PilC